MLKIGQAGLINLTFVADDNDKGKISIKMNTASWGELSVEAKVTQSDVSMYVKAGFKNCAFRRQKHL